MHERRGGIWCYFVLALATSPTQVVAAEYYLQPSVGARYEFDDNRSLSEPTESASTWRFSPLVQFGRLTPNSSVTGAARVDVNKSNAEAVDSTDLFFGILPSYRTERSVWTLHSTYIRDTTLRTDIFNRDFGQQPLLPDSALTGTDGVTGPPRIPGEDTPNFDDPNLQDSGIGERAQEVQRNLLVISPQWTRELTPRMGLGLGYRYVDTFYSNAGGSGLVDSRRHLANANLSYRWSEVDNVSVYTSFQNFQNDANSEFDTYRIELGWTHRFSETLRAVASGGPEYTDNASGGSSDLSYSFRFGVRKELESSNLSILFRRAVDPSEGGNALERNQIDVRWLGDISPRWSFAFLARAFRNEDTGGSGSGSRDRSYAQVEPTISYALTENIFLGLGYRFRWQDADQSAFAHAVAVSVGYRLDRFGFSR